MEYLQSLEAVRERSLKVFEWVKSGKSSNFSLDLSKLPQVGDFIAKLILRDYGSFDEAGLAKIPPHGRWLHFGNDRVLSLVERLGGKDADGCLEAILDLFVVGVLLDAGAGNQWSYKDQNGKVFNRSEGLAVATFEMFEAGHFSSDKQFKFRVDAEGLESLTLEQFTQCFQISEKNPLVGLEGRFGLLKRLAEVLKDDSIPYFTGSQLRRPSNFLTHILKQADSKNGIEIDRLWEVVIKGFGKVWPEFGVKVDGVSLRDVWSLPMEDHSQATIVPFHKLSQWMTYSLMDPIKKLSKFHFLNAEKLTGLPEYRNGGLFIDLEVIIPEDIGSKKEFKVSDPLIVEWRALTVVLLDMVAKDLCGRLGVSPDELTLPMVLEAGTWKAGREMAALLRPTTKNPPISIISDGTVF